MNAALPDDALLAAELDDRGFALLPGLLTPDACIALRGLYQDDQRFRTTVDMARHGYGRGRYRYFDHPLPKPVADLRATLYPSLAAVANGWAGESDTVWPESLTALTELCHRHDQRRPTPLLLRYRTGDFNCLHQDIYGAITFPLQVVVLLSRPGDEFTGGELILTEQRPRRQSRAIVVPLKQGDGVVIPVAARREQTVRGSRRVQVRHGVGEVTGGERTSLGLIFHDAA